MKKEKGAILRILLPACVFAGLLLLWEVLVRLVEIPLYILPAPSDVVSAFFAEFPVLFGHSLVTLKETAVGMVIAALAGMLLAMVMDAFGPLKNAIYPLLVISQTIPVIVLAPIFIIYLGFGMAPKILTVVLMCFFPVVVSFTDGMSQTDPRLVSLVQAFGAGPLKTYLMVKIPSAAVSLFSGLKVAATYSITGAVVGEWLSSDSGLGYYMLRVKNGYMLDRVFASILVVVLLSLLMNGLVRLLRYLWLPHLRGGKI